MIQVALDVGNPSKNRLRFYLSIFHVEGLIEDFHHIALSEDLICAIYRMDLHI